MARIAVSFAKLHEGIFLGGTNLKNLLNTAAYGMDTLKMYWDEDGRFLAVSFKNIHTSVTEPNVIHWTAFNQKTYDFGVCDSVNVEPVKIQSSAPANKKIKAQVSDPVRDQVFGQGL